MLAHCIGRRTLYLNTNRRVMSTFNECANQPTIAQVQPLRSTTRSERALLPASHFIDVKLIRIAAELLQ